MDNLEVIFQLFMAGIFLFLIIGFAVVIRRESDKRVALAKQAARDGQQKLQVYEDAWSAAQASGNIDAIVRCGDYLVKATHQWLPQRLSSNAWDVYQKLLSLLRTQPDIKPTVLEIGRVAYAARRRGALTIYDEQAIQNDIMAHLG